LIVEDEEKAIKEWKNRLELHNADDVNRVFAITAEYADSLSEVQKLLPSHKFDAAVVDLRLRIHEAARGQHNDQGNNVMNLLTSTEMAAIAVYTGQPGEAIIPEQSPQVQVIEKGEGLDSIMDWLKAESQLIFRMQKAGLIIQKDMALMFHKSIWPRWKYWSKAAPADEAVLDAALTRHLVSHLYANLLDTTHGVHPEEWYFVPPITRRDTSTGDLLRTAEGKIEVVITPRCDIAHDEKSKTIQLAECEDHSAEWALMEADLKDPTKAQKAREKMAIWYQHRKKAVLHFLPKMIGEDGSPKGPWFVRFDSIRSVRKTPELLKDLKQLRFASITSEFLPSLVERLGNFFSRIGSPDASQE
jgi:hypothetical protein